jgi:glycosyltransferase involved in cell wall biosynthesis
MKIAICMPVYNEEQGIESYIKELRESFNHFYHLIIVNDASTDNTAVKLESISKNVEGLFILINAMNLGHGRSMRRAVKHALENKYDAIVTVDGDGQVPAIELLKFTQESLSQNFAYCEGVRINRVDPIYRKLVSLFTRVIVFLLTARYPRDANTPVRYYSLGLGEKLWDQVPEDSIIPNLQMSIIARRRSMKIPIRFVSTTTRRSATSLGSTWQDHGKKKKTYVPPRKFLKFCKLSFQEIFRTHDKNVKN